MAYIQVKEYPDGRYPDGEYPVDIEWTIRTGRKTISWEGK